MRKDFEQGDVYIAREILPKEKLLAFRKYLIGLGQNSLPNYHAIEEGAPNFHRMNRADERAYVKGCFHQWSFFPWNQDIFDVFSLFKDIFHIKNQLSGLSVDKFLGAQVEDRCTSRLGVQHYPSGAGFLNKHSDPVNYHQLVVPIMQLSTKGEDFSSGGLFVGKEDGTQVDVDDITEMGSVVYFNAQVPHGVEAIDPDMTEDWLSFKGRWMVLFAVNKLAGNTDIPDAVDLKK